MSRFSSKRHLTRPSRVLKQLPNGAWPYEREHRCNKRGHYELGPQVLVLHLYVLSIYCLKVYLHIVSPLMPFSVPGPENSHLVGDPSPVGPGRSASGCLRAPGLRPRRFEGPRRTSSGPSRSKRRCAPSRPGDGRSATLRWSVGTYSSRT